MARNGRLPDWPHPTWNAALLAYAEQAVLIDCGLSGGTIRHLRRDGRYVLMIEALHSEALTTSEIEGELLDCASVQSSTRKQLGIANGNERVGDKERGIAAVMVDLHRTASDPLSDQMLFTWHCLVMSGTYVVKTAGAYRVDTESTQTVSGGIADPHVHSEAPPSVQVPDEMA